MNFQISLYVNVNIKMYKKGGTVFLPEEREAWMNKLANLVLIRKRKNSSFMEEMNSSMIFFYLNII